MWRTEGSWGETGMKTREGMRDTCGCTHWGAPGHTCQWVSSVPSSSMAVATGKEAARWLNGRNSQLQRPLQLLLPLKIQSDSNGTNTTPAWHAASGGHLAMCGQAGDSGPRVLKGWAVRPHRDSLLCGLPFLLVGPLSAPLAEQGPRHGLPGEGPGMGTQGWSPAPQAEAAGPGVAGTAC